MCDDWSDGPSAWSERYRVARKEHHCCACRETIRVGDRYHYASGVWDGSGGSFKHCLRCWAMLEALEGKIEGAVLTLDCGEDWTKTIGELPEDVAALAFMTRDEMQARQGGS